MNRRLTSLLLAVVILFGVVFSGAYTVSAAASYTASADCIKMIKAEEGFSKKPYWDYAQYTVGYGSKCPDDMYDYYMANGITEQEAEVLLKNHLSAIERDINSKIVDKYKLTLTQNQFDALVMFSYNCGTGWAYETDGTFHTAIAQGKTGNDIVRAFALWCSAGNEIKTFLLRRRLCEANMYLNGVYSQTPPDNYCYVIYDANGGYSSPRSQGYDSNLDTKPYPVPTYSGYVFDGWYTAKTGGTKVEKLDASTKNMTLYAHWKDASGSDLVVDEKPVRIKVTGSDVNLRKGPGTNYTVIGKAQKGDEFTIRETASGSGYRWGNYGTGWICLSYTNYDTAVKEQANTETKPTEPTPTEPTPTEPEETVPETTTPTEPAPTEPAPTEPAPTEPEVQKVMGTVKVNDWLRIRSGPSTGYSVVDYLKPNARVEILEQKTVGSMVWGKISQGWISMEYVVLDKQSSSSGSTGSTTTTTVTGTVNVQEWLRVRSGPGTSYSLVEYLKPKARVEILEQKKVGSTTWGKIASGWISMDYVILDKQSSSSGSTGSNNTGSNTTTTTSITGYANVQDWLRVRSGPGTSYSVVTYLKPKEQVTITELRTVGSTQWGKVSNGWVSMDYITRTSQSSSGSTAVQTKTITADCLRVRSDAGTGYKIVGYLYYGAKVQILETKTGTDGATWGKISTGWISMNYAK